MRGGFKRLMVVQWLSRVQLLASFPLECLQQARAGRHCAPRLRVCAVCRLCRVWSRDTDMHCLLLFSRSVVSDSLPPMGCSPPGPPVHHQLPEFTQTHVHLVGDAIQQSISSSVVLFSSCLQSFQALESFQMSQLFASGGQIIGVSASASLLPMNTQN